MLPRDVYGYSQFHQAGALVQIFETIQPTNKFFVEFGARRPGILNSAYFRIHLGWSGVLFDGSPGESPNGGSMQYDDIQELLSAPDTAKCILRKEFLTMENVSEIFQTYNVPNVFDLLTIDIDMNDYYIARSILEKGLFRPRVFCIEFSSYFHSNESFVPVYNPKSCWDGTSVTNSSLLALHELFTYYNYSYITHIAGEHAIYVSNTELEEQYKYTPIPNSIQEGWQYLKRVAKVSLDLDKWDTPYPLSYKFVMYLEIGEKEQPEPTHKGHSKYGRVWHRQYPNPRIRAKAPVNTSRTILLAKHFPNDTQLYLQKSKHKDRFAFSMQDTMLHITLFENEEGWKHNHSIMCYSNKF